jgi:uncharacterized membrane protein (DUF106 family)
MSILNTIMNALFGALLFPFRSLPPIVGVAVMAVLTGVGMLLIFKATSNQERIKSTKARIFAGIYEIRLFNDDLGAILRSQAEILASNLVYLRYSLVPMLWMIVPIVLVIAQLQSHYGYDGLEIGRPAIVRVELSNDWEQDPRVMPDGGAQKPAITLEAPEGLRIETEPVWIPSLDELAWRIVPDQPGDYELAAVLGGERFTKRVSVTDEIKARAPIRTRPDFFKQLLYPAERPLPGSGPIRSINIDYEDRAIDVFGLGIHWLILFFVISIIVAFALKGRMKVEV